MVIKLKLIPNLHQSYVILQTSGALDILKLILIMNKRMKKNVKLMKNNRTKMMNQRHL